MVWASSSIGSLIQDGHDQHWPGIQCFKIINVDCPSHRWLQQNPRILAWPHPSLSQPCSSTLEPTLNNSCQGSNIGGLAHVPIRNKYRQIERSSALCSLKVKKKFHDYFHESQIFVQKFNFDKTPTFSGVFHPIFFDNFSREIKVVNS